MYSECKQMRNCFVAGRREWKVFKEVIGKTFSDCRPLSAVFWLQALKIAFQITVFILIK